MEGKFDFNKTTLAYPGTKVVVHGKRGKHKYWDPYGVDGCYPGPSMEHYMCYTVYITKINKERIIDTVKKLWNIPRFRDYPINEQQPMKT